VVRTPADTATTYASQSFMAFLLRYSTSALLSTRAKRQIPCRFSEARDSQARTGGSFPDSR
jgi:hypothetical protein